MWTGTTFGDKVYLSIVYTVIVLICIACVYPMYLTVIASISDPYDVYNGKAFLVPAGAARTIRHLCV